MAGKDREIRQVIGELDALLAELTASVGALSAVLTPDGTGSEQEGAPA